MQVGKDSVADVLVRRYGFVRRGFADALKDEVLDRLPRTLGAYLESTMHLENTADRRRLMYELKPPLSALCSKSTGPRCGGLTTPGTGSRRSPGGWRIIDRSGSWCRT